MKKLTAYILSIWLLCGTAFAQIPVLPCYQNNGSCVSVSSTTPLPVTLGTAGVSIAIGGTVTNGTAGSVLFINPNNTLAQDNANFFWDATNHRLGIGTASPAAGTQVDIEGGLLTANTKQLNVVSTFNNAGVTFDAPIFESITNTASNVSSKIIDLQVGGVSVFLDDINGIITIPSSGGIVNNGALTQNGNFTLASTKAITWSGRGNIVSPAANDIQIGANDAAAPAAQTFGFQSVVGGTSNTAGVNSTIIGSKGTGTGTGGSLIFQTSPASTTGSTQNAGVTALTIPSGGDLQLSGQIPAASAGTITPGSTSNKGSISGLVAATTETITFNAGAPLSAAPACLFDGSTTLSTIVVSSISTTAVTATFASFSGTLYYHCF